MVELQILNQIKSKANKQDEQDDAITIGVVT